jgi:hypothetical protein
MRMWGINPKTLCRKHLLGEHVEMHMFVGVINKGSSIKGYLGKGLIEPRKIKERHNELRLEMISRGYKHKSPLPVYNYIGANGKVDIKRSLNELKKRCKECRNRIERII